MQSFLDEVFAKFHPALINLINSVSDWSKAIDSNGTNHTHTFTIVDGKLDMSAWYKGSGGSNYITVIITSQAAYDVTYYDKVAIAGSIDLKSYKDYHKVDFTILLKNKLTGATTIVYETKTTSTMPNINDVINKEVDISSLTDEHYVVISITGVYNSISSAQLNKLELIS